MIYLLAIFLHIYGRPVEWDE
ncbi:hypothetical protein SEA_POTATOSPLIT_72 [Mycobacterium phage PotatoSplit]|uniref:Uncharacterized protein n=35 Tax=Microwolfvirus TaxID=2942894 RepID=A0A345L1I0_9CAUD|nr:hypothetical protein PBI_BXZ2_66 [Mycobacterium phage Bxz2]YP_009195168.1 hypothetical protein AVT20_gp29 [Mycobacterium phage Tiffany]YP_009198496.1 hypothetical protein AVV34_gp29 [Mycobacterium phage MarQuardt]YP_009219133.1 hypothetical protein AVV42_gp31 [Mycobacterium phage Anubis]YP_010060111.1 hypothetical protein KIJ58_gp30 [Mycobacterium phage SoilDragon]AIM51211.1 hypothetical protein PBI_FARBER_71 [Mycobacterium phage Farber]AJA41854.1 hypothetical protein PBI_SPIKE509_71 [Myco